MKLVLVGAFAAGYVFGSKAGRERYEQIGKVARLASQRLEAYGEGGSRGASRPPGDTASEAADGSSRRE